MEQDMLSQKPPQPVPLPLNLRRRFPRAASGNPAGTSGGAPSGSSPAAPAGAPSSNEAPARIGIDDFTKIEMRVGS